MMKVQHLRKIPASNIAVIPMVADSHHKKSTTPRSNSTNHLSHWRHGGKFRERTKLWNIREGTLKIGGIFGGIALGFEKVAIYKTMT